MMGVHQQLFGKRVLLDFKKKSSGQQAHIVTWTRPYPAQNMEHGVEMRGTTFNWCCIVQIVVGPSIFGFSNLIDNKLKQKNRP